MPPDAHIIGKGLNLISFDITNSYLLIEIGTIDISALSRSTIPQTILEHNPKCRSITISSDGVWVTYDSETLVWLPSEYRLSCSAVLWKTIDIGVGTGRV